MASRSLAVERAHLLGEENEEMETRVPERPEKKRMR
jgi:hypothetical protein